MKSILTSDTQQISFRILGPGSIYSIVSELANTSPCRERRCNGHELMTEDWACVHVSRAICELFPMADIRTPEPFPLNLGHS